MKTIITLSILLLCGCAASVKKPAKTVVWVDMGVTVSQSVPESSFFQTVASIQTSKGTVYSTEQVFSPFLVGEPIKVTNDGRWAWCKHQTIRLQD